MKANVEPLSPEETIEQLRLDNMRLVGVIEEMRIRGVLLEEKIKVRDQEIERLTQRLRG